MTDKTFYEGYEDLKNFTPESLVAYRRALLQKSQHQVDFICRHVKPNTVLEVGCGNGRLLFGLALSYCSPTHLVGVDSSKSRIKFAEQWELDLFRSRRIKFLSQDIKNVAFKGRFDLAVCITGCFNYFQGEDKHVMASKLRSLGKYALFELYKRPTNPRSWHALPPSDPFIYLLDDYTPDNPTTHTKTFIKRDGTVDVRTEQLYYYDKMEFLRLLKQAGFKTIHWDKENSTSRVVLVS